MSESQPVPSEAFEASDIYPDENNRRVVGILEGNKFNRYIRIDSPGRNMFELPAGRKVMIAVIVDENGNLFYEPYDPGVHREVIELPVSGVREYDLKPGDPGDPDEPDDPIIGPYLGRTRKRRTSRRIIDADNAVRARGGDLDYRMPKEVYHPGKLA